MPIGRPKGIVLRASLRKGNEAETSIAGIVMRLSIGKAVTPAIPLTVPARKL